LLSAAEELALRTGGVVLWASLSGHLNNELFLKVREKYEAMGLVQHANKIEKTITIGPKHGRIVFKSMERPDGMRGQHPDYIFCDEIAFWDPDAWNYVLNGMTKRKDKGRKVVMSSTPAGPQGVWWDIYQGITTNNPAYKNWEWLHFTYESNPFADLKEMEAARASLPPQIFEQEFLAKFVEPGGAAFNNYKDCMIQYTPPSSPQQFRSYYMGVDVGQLVDSCAYVVMDDVGMVVDYFVFANMNVEGMCSMLLDAVKRWRPARCVIERNNQGAFLYQVFKEYVEKRGMGTAWLSAVDTRPDTKAEMVHKLYADFANKRVKIPASKEFAEQLSDFKMLGSVAGGGIYPRYGAVSGRRDDLVMALCIANYLRGEGAKRINLSNFVMT